MKKFEFTQPDFLFCEIGIKNDSQNDDRIWIYHRKSLSLIEFINVDDFDDFDDFEFSGKLDRFEYLNENWFGVFVQNNCEATDNNADLILKSAWNYLKEYFVWEDSQDEE